MNILRPLSPHLPIYKPQLTSTFPISHRISGAFLATIVLVFYLLCLKMGLICFFQSLLSKVGFSLAKKFMHFLLIKVGCSGRLAKAMDLAVRAFFLFHGDAPLMISAGENAPSPVGSIGSIESDAWWVDAYSPNPQLPAGEGTSGAGHGGSRSPLSSESTHSWLDRLIEGSPQPAEPSHQLDNAVPEVPQEDLWNELEQPLLSEIERKEQTERRLLIYLPLETDTDHLRLKEAVETHCKVEIEVERHLRMGGKSPASIKANLMKIRELILTTQRNQPRSQTELKRFLREMEKDWASSRPCQILKKAKKGYSIFL